MKYAAHIIAAASLLATAGCSIPYASDESRALNFCSADSDCGPGSYCAAVGDEQSCIASSVDLAGLTLEVRPALGNGAKVTSPSLITPPPLAAGDGSQLLTLNLGVPDYVDVSPGRVFLPCAGETPVPAQVTFHPSPGLSGLLEGEQYKASSMQDNEGNEAFAASVPPGVYDVFLQPQPDLAVTPDCMAAPPIFLPKQVISKDVGFAVYASKPLLLKGTLKLSQKEDFTQWYLEVVEPFSGQIISEFIQPKQVGIQLQVPFQLWFDWSAREKFTPIVRLRPPEGSGKPVIHWSLDAVALEGISDDEVPVFLDVSGIDTQPRDVGGTVFHDGEPVSATVTLRSLSISGDKLTRYQTVVETNGEGQFASALPPGEYLAIARPHRADLAVGVEHWVVEKSSDCYCGKSITVPTAMTVAGSVFAPSGEPANVEVRLAPAATDDLTYLGDMLADDVQPRAVTVSTDSGAFQAQIDGGSFNLSLVPQEGSGYPWFVRPHLLVQSVESQEAPVTTLEPLQLQSPVVVRGRITDASRAAMPNATVRAWIPVGDAVPGTVAASAVQIGETVADVNGEYFLLLPPSIK